MFTKKTRIIIIISLAMCLFCVYTFALFTRHADSPKLPILGQIKNFELIDQEGDVFSLKELDGQIWTANFIFTTCAGICPIMTKNMAALHRSFMLLGDVKQVSITVNPEFDSSSILAKYAQKYDVNTSKWHFLTGTRAQIKELAVKSFQLGSIEEPVFHSSKFALVDRQGHIRGYYDGVQPGEVSQLFKDVSLLLVEK